MGILFGLAPWIVYWILVGNVPFLAAAVVALAIAVAAVVVGRAAGAPARTFEIGAVAAFLVLTVLPLLLDTAVLQPWIQPLSMASIFVVALASVLIGRPFVREYAEASQPDDVMKTEYYGHTVGRLTWMWVAAFAVMTVSSLIPPITTSVVDAGTPLSYICYWIIPFTVLGSAIVSTRQVLDRMAAGADDVVRSTTFVAFAEAEIDQLFYLAQQHANREVGVGKEAYDVKIGSKGVPLVGDDTRESWPSTYRVREARR